MKDKEQLIECIYLIYCNMRVIVRVKYEVVFIYILSISAQADLLVAMLKESSLPYELSKSNYDNSASNRLILKDGGQSYRVGYYVRADNGVLNFFSNKGKRLFYNTGKSVGVFEGNKGFYCDVLGRANGNYQLSLTEIGEQVLMLAQ